ncbi:MAG TPA: class I SAM-dependent methyltransferase [Acidimicrobiales bacterium]|nr:class I SAM-dependent methyltransferase [Acidimicrobiales bacterium]
MSGPLGGFDPKQTYDAASTDYDDAGRDYWAYLALRVDRLGLVSGERVVDVPCGTGFGLVAAAERVGPTGRVVGLDYAEQMLRVAERRVAAAGLENVELRSGDMTVIDRPEEPFDALVCALGVFFVDDMRGLVQSFVELVRPERGRVAVSVFGEQFVEPMRSVFVDAVNAVVPGFDVLQPWCRTDRENVLRSLFDGIGVVELTVSTETDRLALRSADDWWRIVMGSGLRRTVTEIGEGAAALVHRRCDDFIEGHGLTEVVSLSRYAVARRA